MNQRICFQALTIIFVMAGCMAYAEGHINDDFEYNFYGQATTGEELKIRHKMMLEYKTLKQGCELQLQKNLIPAVCFNKIQLVQKIHHLSKLHTMTDDYFSKRVAQLDEFCERAVQNSSLLEVSDHLKASLSPKCLESLQKQVAINRYKKGIKLSF